MSMSPDELKVFKSQYRDDFTETDYINWLLLYREDRQDLPYLHLENLHRLERGESIKQPDRLDKNLDVTGLTNQPYMFANANDYFKSMYDGSMVTKYLRNDGRFMLEREREMLNRMQTPQLTPLNDQMTRTEASSPDDFLGSNYADFPQMAPEDVTKDAKYKGQSQFWNNKIDAHELNYYIRPTVVTGDLETIIGRKYRLEKENEILSKNEHQEDYHKRAGTDNFDRPIYPSQSAFK